MSANGLANPTNSASTTNTPAINNGGQRQTIGDNSNQLTYSGNWRIVTGDTNYDGGNYHVASELGDAVLVNFDGIKVEILGAKRATYGNFIVELDGKSIADVSSRSSGVNAVDTFRQSIFTSSTLSPGAHQLRLINMGDGFDVDSVIVTKSQSTPPQDSTSIILGVVFGVIGLLAVLISTLLIIRYRRNKRKIDNGISGDDMEKGSDTQHLVQVQPYQFSDRETVQAWREQVPSRIQVTVEKVTAPPPLASIDKILPQTPPPALQEPSYMNRMSRWSFNPMGGTSSPRRSTSFETGYMTPKENANRVFDTRRVTSLYATPPIVREYTERDTAGGKKFKPRVDLLDDGVPVTAVGVSGWETSQRAQFMAGYEEEDTGIKTGASTSLEDDEPLSPVTISTIQFASRGTYSVHGTDARSTVSGLTSGPPTRAGSPTNASRPGTTRRKKSSRRRVSQRRQETLPPVPTSPISAVQEEELSNPFQKMPLAPPPAHLQRGQHLRGGMNANAGGGSISVMILPPGVTVQRERSTEMSVQVENSKYERVKSMAGLLLEDASSAASKPAGARPPRKELRLHRPPPLPLGNLSTYKKFGGQATIGTPQSGTVGLSKNGGRMSILQSAVANGKISQAEVELATGRPLAEM